MKVGIVGLPGSGKTTLFKALTRGTVSTEHFHSGRANVGVISVPDRRVDFLAQEFKPKKVTYAHIEFVDGAARVTEEDGRAKFAADFFVDVRQVDALVDVVRGFEGAAGEPPTPVEDLRQLRDELVFADLTVVDNRIQRLEKQLHGVKKGLTTPETIEMQLLRRLRESLEQGQSLQTLDLHADETQLVRGYAFLTLKPLIAVLNIPERNIGVETDQVADFRRYCEQEKIPEIELCAQFEMETSELSDEEESQFLRQMGIAEPARTVLIRECRKALGLITFLTAREAEVRAWTLPEGSTALDAAATIHSDIARGFIKAEVANFVDVEVAGGWEAAKQKGLVQLHGKDYVVNDGDVIYVRFKV